MNHRFNYDELRHQLRKTAQKREKLKAVLTEVQFITPRNRALGKRVMVGDARQRQQRLKPRF